MKRKIKLRDMTSEQWDANKDSLCNFCCSECVFKPVNCLESIFRSSWINHKDIFEDKFLDKEIEIEEQDILDKEEKEYLSAVIKPFRDKVISIKKLIYFGCYHKVYFINIQINNNSDILGFQNVELPYFQDNMYEKMEIDKKYTVEDLGL